MSLVCKHLKEGCKDGLVKVYVSSYLCCTGAGTVPGTGTGAGTGYGIFQKTKVRVR